MGVGEGSHTVAFLLSFDILNTSVLIKELFYPPPTGIFTEKGNTLKQMLWSEKRAVSCFSKKKKKRKRNSLNTNMEVLGLVCSHLAWCCIVLCPWAHIRDIPEKERLRGNERERERERERHRGLGLVVFRRLVNHCLLRKSSGG